MLDWIMENKNWLFSGVLVAVPLAVIGWVCSKRSTRDINIGSHNSAKGDQHINIGSSVHQADSSNGDNTDKKKNPKE